METLFRRGFSREEMTKRVARLRAYAIQRDRLSATEG